METVGGRWALAGSRRPNGFSIRAVESHFHFFATTQNERGEENVAGGGIQTGEPSLTLLIFYAS